MAKSSYQFPPVPGEQPPTDWRPRGRGTRPPRPAPPPLPVPPLAIVPAVPRGQEPDSAEPAVSQETGRRPRVIDHDVLEQYRVLTSPIWQGVRKSYEQRSLEAWNRRTERARMKVELEAVWALQGVSALDEQRASMTMTRREPNCFDDPQYGMGAQLRHGFTLHLDREAGYCLPVRAAWERLQETKADLATAVSLRYLHDVSIKDAAERLEVSEAAITHRAAQGLDLLVAWSGATAPSAVAQEPPHAGFDTDR